MRLVTLSDEASEIEKCLSRGILPPPRLTLSEIRFETGFVTVRDGTRLATDIYRGPDQRATTVAVRSPYGRDTENAGFVGALISLARRGFVVVSQDCRGTGDSDPDNWDYYMYECDDSYDLVEWIKRQEWFNGSIVSCGGSYVGQTQWCMSVNPTMSTIVPSMSGLGIGVSTVHLYMFLNAYARTVGKGQEKVGVSVYEMERVFERETMSGGYYNEPLHESLSKDLIKRWPELKGMGQFAARTRLWELYCGMTCRERAEFVMRLFDVKNVTAVEVESLSGLFGCRISHDRHALPAKSPAELARMIKCPVLLRTGWYDWGLNDALATWEALQEHSEQTVASQSRMIITPSAHNMPGYRVGGDKNPELFQAGNMANLVPLLIRWYDSVIRGRTDQWPRIIYYLMGANEWHAADAWPIPEASVVSLFFGEGGTLRPILAESNLAPDVYVYDPANPTPTVGGSIVSFLLQPGSVDVRELQEREDVLTYTTEPLDCDLDVVGPLRVILYARSSARDTDFAARLTDVFPDGQAIQLQNGMLRARYRNSDREPELLAPEGIYRFVIDMWATANRFKAGHRIRIDISSADFPRFDRNANRGGEEGEPIPATQMIYRDAEHPSCVLLPVVGARVAPGCGAS